MVAPPVGILSPVGVAPVGALLATVALFGIVGGVYRVETDPGEDIDTGYQILAGAYVALIGASIVLTDWAIRWLGFPRWVLAVVLVTLIALFYPMVLYKVSKEKTESATDDQRSWQTDSGGNAEDATTDANELPSDAGDEETTADQTTAEASGWLGRTRRRLRENRRENIAEWRARWAERWALVVAVAAELRRAVTLPYRSRGLPGVAAVALVAVSLFAAPFVLTDSRATLFVGLAAAVGCAVTAAHLGSELRAELAETVVLRELDDHLAESAGDTIADAPDDATADRVRERVTRLAAGANLPAPAVRVVARARGSGRRGHDGVVHPGRFVRVHGGFLARAKTGNTTA